MENSSAPKKRVTKITPETIRKEIVLGLNIICATCPHWYIAQERGQDGCDKTSCGGPLLGRDFPDYTGQIPRNQFSKLCLLCGEFGDGASVIPCGPEQKFALCLKHKDSFDSVVLNPSVSVTQIPPTIIKFS